MDEKSCPTQDLDFMHTRGMRIGNSCRERMSLYSIDLSGGNPGITRSRTPPSMFYGEPWEVIWTCEFTVLKLLLNFGT